MQKFLQAEHGLKIVYKYTWFKGVVLPLQFYDAVSLHHLQCSGKVCHVPPTYSLPSRQL